MLITLTVASAIAVVASATLLGIREPGGRVAGVPDVSRMLVRQAIVEQPENIESLAYARRADELVRLRDLPVTPVRAVAEYAERAQDNASGKPGDSADAPVATPPAQDTPPAQASPPAEAPVAEAAAPSPPSEPAAVANLPATTQPAADAVAATAPPAATQSETATKPDPVAPPPAATQTETAAAPDPIAPTSATPLANEPPATARDPRQSDPRLATPESGASEIAAPDRPSVPATPKTEHPKTAHKPSKRPHMTRLVRTMPPTAATGFAVSPQASQESRTTDQLLDARLRADP